MSRARRAALPSAALTVAPLLVELAAALRSAPRGFYVNVHTAAFPAGAIRGQLQESAAKR